MYFNGDGRIYPVSNAQLYLLLTTDLSGPVHGLQTEMPTVYDADHGLIVADQTKSHALLGEGHGAIHSAVVWETPDPGNGTVCAHLHLYGSISVRAVSIAGVRTAIPFDGAPGNRERRETVRDDATDRCADGQRASAIFRVRHYVGHSRLLTAGERLVDPEHGRKSAVPGGGARRKGRLRHGQGGVYL